MACPAPLACRVRCWTRSPCAGPAAPAPDLTGWWPTRPYSHPSTRAALRCAARASDRVHLAERDDQITRRREGSRGGRPPAFDQAIYAGRNVVERCFNRLKQFRGLATRYAKRAAYFRAEIIIVA
jgi:transposase